MLRSLERATALIIAVLLLVVSSTLVIRYLTPRGETANSGRWGQVLAHFGTGKRHAGAAFNRPDPGAQSGLRLASHQTVPYPADETAPLGIEVSGKAAGLAVEIAGLPAGTAISSGRPLGAGAWRVPATDIGNAMIHPPRGFNGAINLAVELRLADDTIVDRGALHLEWMAEASSGPVESAPGLVLSDKAVKDTPAPLATADADAIHGADFGSRQAQRRLSLLASRDVGVAVDRADDAHKVEPGLPARDTASVVAAAKPRRHVARHPVHASAADPYASYAVYAAGVRAGVDPDAKVRLAIMREYAWMN